MYAAASFRSLGCMPSGMPSTPTAFEQSTILNNSFKTYSSFIGQSLNSHVGIDKVCKLFNSPSEVLPDGVCNLRPTSLKALFKTSAICLLGT